MTHFDVFNGDADGLCALHQLRLDAPRPSRLITGVKRDNALLCRVDAAPGDSVTVVDLSLAPNIDALEKLLAGGVSVEYFDHHHAPRRPEHPALRLVIDPAADVCTSVLVDRHLHGAHRAWAVVGAFGDNLAATAEALAATLGLDAGAIARLRELGECLNYNGYGDSEDDLLYPPAELYRRLHAYADPLRFIAAETVLTRLAEQRARDLADAEVVPPLLASDSAQVFRLPDAAWSRRVVGSFANRLAAADPAQAFAILVPNRRGTLTASLRIAAASEPNADAFARRYGGDGRRLAAGVNDLQAQDVEAFAADFVRTY